METVRFPIKVAKGSDVVEGLLCDNYHLAWCIYFGEG